ncbi:hypothetical protein [Dactylosporangium sp. NPDC051484]|uniref:hypothetical protein n=1 Tax=Dactylosporangium sp. NPDC051484 TaxID=3154942 RepID=UPI00344D332D
MVLLLAALTLAAPALAACDDDPPSVGDRLAAFLAAWRKADFTGVGVEPQRVPDVGALVKRLGLVFRSVRVDVGVQALPDRIGTAKPDAFVEVLTPRRSDYTEIAGDLTGTDGVRALSLPMTRTFARALLGASGPARKELIDASSRPATSGA